MNTKYTLILGILLITSLTLSAQNKTVKKTTTKTTTTKTTAVKQNIDTVKIDPVVQAEMEQKAWMEYMTPGKMHQLLLSANGIWHEEITFWMAPDALPTTAETECTNTMILGDRYQESIHTGMMMGMPFEGKGTIGYDNAKKMFQSTWIDNMGSGIMFLEGEYDAESKSITLIGKTVDAATGKIENVREVMHFIDENNQKMEMYMTKKGKEFKNMEIKFTRRG